MKPTFGFGKMRASIRECFSLSAAKAPDKVTNEAHAVVPLPIFYVFCKSTVAIYFVVAIISSLCYNNLARAEKENYFKEISK